MTDRVVHSSVNGKTLCGAAPIPTEAFYAVPFYRGTDAVTCAACIAIIDGDPLVGAHPCPICGNKSPAGQETDYICNNCWRGASVAFSMSTAGPESHAEFGATMDVARLSAATARVLMRKLLRRERVTRFWQSIQWFALAVAMTSRHFRFTVVMEWCRAEAGARATAQLRALGDGSSRTLPE